MHCCQPPRTASSKCARLLFEQRRAKPQSKNTARLCKLGLAPNVLSKAAGYNNNLNLPQSAGDDIGQELPCSIQSPLGCSEDRTVCTYAASESRRRRSIFGSQAAPGSEKSECLSSHPGGKTLSAKEGPRNDFRGRDRFGQIINDIGHQPETSFKWCPGNIAPESRFGAGGLRLQLREVQRPVDQNSDIFPRIATPQGKSCPTRASCPPDVRIVTKAFPPGVDANSCGGLAPQVRYQSWAIGEEVRLLIPRNRRGRM